MWTKCMWSELLKSKLFYQCRSLYENVLPLGELALLQIPDFHTWMWNRPVFIKYFNLWIHHFPPVYSERALTEVTFKGELDKMFWSIMSRQKYICQLLHVFDTSGWATSIFLKKVKNTIKVTLFRGQREGHQSLVQCTHITQRKASCWH